MYWSLLLNQHLTGLGFIRSKSDTSLYTYIGPDGKWCAIAVFVDDLLITGTSTAKIDELRTYLDRTFKGEGAWDECVNVTRRCQQEELSLKRESVGTPSTLRRQSCQWNKGD